MNYVFFFARVARAYRYAARIPYYFLLQCAAQCHRAFVVFVRSCSVAWLRIGLVDGARAHVCVRACVRVWAGWKHVLCTTIGLMLAWRGARAVVNVCLLYTSDAADE